MAAFRRVVVVAVLAIWCFPSVSLAKSEPVGPVPLREAGTSAPAPSARATPRTDRGSPAEAVELGAREKQSRNLEDWKGGGGSVYFYIGSGLLLVLIVVLLLVLI